MSTPLEIIPEHGFDPMVFWEQHKSKIVLYTAIVAAVVLIFGVYQMGEQRKIAKAQELFSQAKTEAQFRNVIQTYPNSTEAGNARILMGEQLRFAKKYDESAAVLREFIAMNASHPLADGAYLSLGETLEAQGKTAEALDTYQQIISQFSDRYSAPVAQMARANIFRTQGKTDEAKRAYENVQAQFPDSFFARQAVEEAKLLNR